MPKKGQIAVEYLLVIAAVVVVLIYVARPGGEMSNSLNAITQGQGNNIKTMANRIFK